MVMRIKGIIGAAILVAFLAGATFAEQAGGTASPPAASGTASPQAQAAVQKMMMGPSVFIENQGQWADSDIKFALDSRGMNVGLTDKGPRFQLFKQEKQGPTQAERSEDVSVPGFPGPDGAKSGTVPSRSARLGQSPISQMHEFRLVFEGASLVTPVGRGRSERKFNYLKGDPSTHREGVGSFDAVWYEGLYPGVSLELTGKHTGLKYNFHVAPGADPKAIRLRYDGIAGLSLRDDGALEIRVKDGWEPLADGAPYIYQEVNGEKKPVAGMFTLLDDNAYGFEILGDHDSTSPLVIDPGVVWSTYIGGDNGERGRAVAVDASGNIYVAGDTNSSNWISNGWRTTSGGGYVVKLTQSGNHVWSTYLGGIGISIAVDTMGAVYVTGMCTDSNWGVSGGWDTTYGGGTNYGDGYVVKLDHTGAHLWSTYLGGTGEDAGRGIAVDSARNVYVSGNTDSTGWVSGGWDTTKDLMQDAFVVKISMNGEHLWSTYLGGGEMISEKISRWTQTAMYIRQGIQNRLCGSLGGTIRVLMVAMMAMWQSLARLAISFGLRTLAE